ncbi:MAG TPA: hypothetical protein VK727_19130 [Steroidobacteraceae bacterium]|nr:hypothetical protein [Steroidobacteraceae bacterium]
MNDADEHEWQAQERALQAERLGLDATDDDARLRRYRLLARTLRQPLPATLPLDFASQIAARLTAPPAEMAPVSGRFESILLGVLAGLLVVCAAVVLARDGQAWLPAIRATLPAADVQDLRWLLAFVGCLGCSWLLWQGPRRVH